MPGPLSTEALARFADHLSELAGRRMVLDPGSPGHEVYDDNRARYQFAVEGGRPANDQGVVLKVTGDPEVWIVRHNVVWAGYHIRDGHRTMEERVLSEIETVLPSCFAAVLAEFMAPYEGLV